MPEHNDPIEELARFGAGLGSATPGGDMPLSAADVRRRGDQIRRRRTALVAGGAALAVAAVAVPVFAVIGGGDPRTDDSRTADDPATPALAVSDLLRDDDTQYELGRHSAFATTDTFEGDGQATYLPCQRSTLSGLGATNSFTRTWTYLPDPAVGEVPEKDVTDDDLTEVVAEFETADAARAAYDRFAEWIVDCDGHIAGADHVNVAPQGRSVDVPDGDGVIYDLNWGPVPKNLDPSGDFGYISETGLVLQGDRIAVLSVKIVGQDYSWLDEEGGTPVKRMLPTAARRLLPGAEKGQPTEPATSRPATEDTEAGGEPGGTTIPADFPVFEGWPATAGDGKGRTGPDRPGKPLDLEACGQQLPDATGADRLRAGFDNAEDYRTRQLTTFASAEEAAAMVAAIRDLYSGCSVGEVRDDGFTPNWAVRPTDIGEESLAVLGWDELDGAPTPYGDTLLVVRVGSAVLVVVHSGEGGAPSGGQDQRAVDQIVQESAPVVDAMCTWTAAGC